jgi:(1->4)-alpha-D-glucan 1-alpha-D-glucosylmutase
LLYGRILAAGGPLLRPLAAEFVALRGLRRGGARSRAQALKHRLAEAATNPHKAGAIDAAVRSWAGTPDRPASFRPLHRLLDAQAYRLAYWRVAAHEINYRRFFNINDLAGLRVELPELFADIHRMTLAMVERGDVDGLRIDHIDGLFDPGAYLAAPRQLPSSSRKFSPITSASPTGRSMAVPAMTSPIRYWGFSSIPTASPP